MRPEGKSALKDSHIVSVIIPTIGRPSLASCREALEQQTRLPDEIIVVKDEERRGAAWARNEGIRRSSGDLIAFTDDDCVPPPEWLEQLVDAVDRFDAAGAGGGFVDVDPLLQDIRARRERRLFGAVPDRARVDTEGLVGSGGSILYRRAWLERCAAEDGHIFNPAFRVSQDWDLAFRLRRRGATFAFIPARVLHKRHMTPGDFFRLQFGRGIGIARLFRSLRDGGAAAPGQRSLLWGAPGRAQKPRWLAALWSKVFGPFDMGSFTRKRHFWLFWVGEKVQGVGFFWGLLARTGEPLDVPSPARQEESLPTFSIVIETENLANTPVEELSRCLEELAHQDLPLDRANEVLVIQSGDVPPKLLQRIQSRFPWLTVIRTDADTGYYEAKMEGARLATGEVVVLCDSDCRYATDWLRQMVLPFGRNRDVHVVGGETALSITGPYSLAMSLIWVYPVFPRCRDLYRWRRYHANNVAFRRATLLGLPIPGRQPMYRGNGEVHARMLRRAGYEIWRQPAARVMHPLPANGIRPFFWRWLLFGHDLVLQERFSETEKGTLRWRSSAIALLKLISIASWKPIRRLGPALIEDPGRIVWVPAAFFIGWAAVVSAMIGFMVAHIQPGAVVAAAAKRLKDKHISSPVNSNP